MKISGLQAANELVRLSLRLAAAYQHREADPEVQGLIDAVGRTTDLLNRALKEVEIELPDEEFVYLNDWKNKQEALRRRWLRDPEEDLDHLREEAERLGYHFGP